MEARPKEHADDDIESTNPGSTRFSSVAGDEEDDLFGESLEDDLAKLIDGEADGDAHVGDSECEADLSKVYRIVSDHRKQTWQEWVPQLNEGRVPSHRT